MVSQHPAKSGVNWRCYSADILSLICHMISEDTAAQRPSDILGYSTLR